MNVTIWLIVLCGAIFAATLIASLIFSFNGIWERMDSASSLAKRERIRLSQLGFLVVGKRTVVGGYQTFFGIAIGPQLWMRRRDFGIAFLAREGFPEDIAKQVEGQVLGKYRLRLSQDRDFLTGDFVPYRVEFSGKPPYVTAINEQTHVPRKYRRIESLFDEDIAAVSSSAK